MSEKKRLNLFNRQRANTFGALTAKTIFYTTIGGGILFIVFIALIVFTFFTNKKIATIEQEKNDLISYLDQNKNVEAQNTYFILKNDQLKSFLKDDAEFLPYYTLLKNALPTATSSAKIQNMTMDKSKKTDFTIIFANYSDMYQYIHYIESDEFLQNFSALKLASFSLNATGGVSGYQLHFTGAFNNLPENTAKL